MSKAFSDREREVIKKALVDACKECWQRYGYQKTGVRELSAMANISNGAFYQFYGTKELLFVETAQTYDTEMEAIFRENMERQPNKRGIAEGLKAIAAWLRATPWIRSMLSDWPMIARKLPPDFAEKDFAGDRNRIERFAAGYGIKSRHDIDVTTQIISILAMSATRLDYLAGDGAEAADFIIDAVVDKLFE